MAYNTKYKFAFDSVGGTKYEIWIRKENYSGSVIERGLGSSPILRRDSNGSICGTSLEIPAECLVDGEFAEFYTTKPYEFKVELRANNIFIWAGFVSTEIYAEPDIAPPYDVTITATDGLGELKNSLFQCDGADTLHNIISGLLLKTGLFMTLNYVSGIALTAPEASTANQFFDKIDVNLGHLNGKTCYDVLKALLDTLHASITQLNGEWLLIRETDAVISASGIPAFTKNSGRDFYLPVVQFGSMRTNDWWPIGSMNNEIKPAKNRMVITSNNHYRQLIANPNMSTSSDWILGGTASYDSENHYFALPSNTTSSITQSIELGKRIATPLLLTIKAAAVGDGISEGKLRLTVRKEYDGIVSYLTNKPSRTGEEGQLLWSSSEDDYVTLNLSAPNTGRIDTLQVLLPLYRRTIRDYQYADSLTISIEQLSDGYDKYVYGCTLEVNDQLKGYQNIITINNDAREAGEDVEIAFAKTSQLDKAGIILYGLPLYSGTTNEATFISSSINAGWDYLSFISRDYALSYALPRLIVKGTLNVGYPHCPAGFIDHSGNTYLLQTMSWNLREDEMDVEMLSSPAASITVENEETKALETETLSSGSSTIGNSSSSSGGGSSYVLPVATQTKLGGIMLGPGTTDDTLLPLRANSYGGAYTTLYKDNVVAALGYTPAKEGSYLTEVPIADASTIGGFKTGFEDTQISKAVKVDSYGRAYVDIPESSGGGSTGGTDHYIGTTKAQSAPGTQDVTGVGNLEANSVTIANYLKIGNAKLYVADNKLYLEAEDGTKMSFAATGDIAAMDQGI